jgi:hypothetical protein
LYGIDAGLAGLEGGFAVLALAPGGASGHFAGVSHRRCPCLWRASASASIPFWTTGSRPLLKIQFLSLACRKRARLSFA